MLDRQHSEQLFLEHLGWIERVAAMVCSKQGVWGVEAEEFAAWIKLKLMDDDYAAIRRFRGESSIKTYLATVVTRQFYEYQREQGGRWRPSAAAERLGQLAKELEALVYRDGYRLEQAGEKLRTAGRTTLSDTELGRLLAQVPTRLPLRPVEVPADLVLGGVEGTHRADERVAAAEAEALRGRVLGALERAMARLETEDHAIARMHFQEGRSLADVARALRLDQKPLYRRAERIRVKLRAYLEEEDVGYTDVLGVLWERGAA
ncbi:MAG TPA: sigma-70 family RNA polymerase sigma factor [Longimicrobium sp.]|nr:sigma-70 family RNA polymerase sigma factor [Longimicrobium sp.]